VYYDWSGWLLELVEVRGTGGPQALLVLGYHLGPRFFAQVEGLGRGLRFYRQLDVLKGVYVGGIWLWAAATLIAVGLATLVVARAVARGLSKPLVELARGMEQVASGREGVVVEPKGSRETRFLARTFNRMVDELAAYKRDLARAERAAAWQQVARVIAHEIRNPLTPIQFSIRRIKDRLEALPEADRGAVSESLDSIMGEVETLKALASSFSQFAKLPEPSPSSQDLNKIVAETVELFRQEGRAEFQLALAGDLPPAFVDGSQIRMALNNLLKNALEAMPQGGRVAVSTRAEPGDAPRWAVIEVADTGMGMDPETLSRATDAYFSTKAKGSGLGLAVVQKVVRQHGGTLGISSSPGAGTVVTIKLPLRPAGR
jgi:nitrogen fixation/metabolism regulation signal transduction histidine kinase